MKKYVSGAFLSLLVVTANAQSKNIRVPIGKQFHVVMGNTANTTVVVMGQTVDNVMDISSTQDYELKAVGPTGYTLSMIPRRIKGSISVMGQEQKFDTDDEATKTSAMSTVLTVINKAVEIKIDSGKIAVSGDAATTMSILNGGESSSMGINFFFISPKTDPKQGDSWTDSVTGPDLRVVNQYLINSVTPQQIEVKLTSDSKTQMTMKQMGVDAQTDMKGFSVSTLIYDRKTGLLISQKRASEMAGTVEAMGVKAPMTIKSNLEITVQ